MALVLVAEVFYSQHLGRAVSYGEERWAAQWKTLTPTRAEGLRQSLVKSGLKLHRLSYNNSSIGSSAGSITEVIFEGSPQDYRNLVNKLLAEPLVWSRWSYQEVSLNKIKGTIALKNF